MLDCVLTPQYLSLRNDEQRNPVRQAIDCKPPSLIGTGARHKGSQMRGILTAATFLCLMEATAMADNTASFETDAVGATPKGWIATSTGGGNPKWTIEQDQTAPSKLKVVKQSGRAAYPLLLKDDAKVKDGFIEIKFKAIAGSEDRAAGLVWRARDANNYYVVRANALEDNVVLYKTVGGVRSPLDTVGRSGGYGVAIAVPANVWHHLRIDFMEDR